MKYAVIQTGGKQYRVSEGDVIEVEHLPIRVNDTLTAQVLLLHDEGKINLGTPFVEGMVVKATVLEEVKGDKIRVAKYKAKVRYRKVHGHRQHLSRIKIDHIGKRDERKAAKELKEAKPAETRESTKPLQTRGVKPKPVVKES